MSDGGDLPIVFCDSGGFSPAVQRLRREGKIIAVQGLYEDRSRKADIAKPSSWTFDNPHITFDMDIVTFADTYSSKYDEILRIVGSGPETRSDTLQLDSAYLSKAAAFLTSDKRDIVANKSELEPLLRLRVFYFPDEEPDFLDWVRKGSDSPHRIG
jgi:hypothetical protein